MADATLVIREGDGAGGEYPLDGELVIGREPGSADLVLADPGISRRHAAVRALGGAVTVEDLGSSNGTFVNGKSISGEVELAQGDEVQVGGTVLSLRPAPAGRPRGRGPAPGRLAPRPDEESNIPALASVFLGPLSIFLLLFSSGAAFFICLPCAIGAIVLGNVGMRKVDAGETDSHRTLAKIGRVCGVIGAVLSSLALIAFLIVIVVLDVTGDSLDGIVEAIRDEIEGVDVPEVPDAPTVDAPEVNPGDEGGVEAP